jgi:PhzF family phenazine biosynthesis protein
LTEYKLFIVNAFTLGISGGNPAGVVWLDEDAFPSETTMQKVAEKLGHSETAFIRRFDAGAGADGIESAGLWQEAEIDPETTVFETRYFTPVAEVDLCGHATIGGFYALLEHGIISDNNNYVNVTNLGSLSIEIVDGTVFMEAGEAMSVAHIDAKDQLKEIYGVMGLEWDGSLDKSPQIVSTGLPDILLPVEDEAELTQVVPDFEKLADLSENYNAVGVHAYTPQSKVDGAYHVRNFAPLYGIDEESATGTANSALAYLLYRQGKAAKGDELRFIQGESMKMPSEIRCLLRDDFGELRIMVGGNAAIAERGEIAF